MSFWSRIFSSPVVEEPQYRGETFSAGDGLETLMYQGLELSKVIGGGNFDGKPHEIVVTTVDLSKYNIKVVSKRGGISAREASKMISIRKSGVLINGGFFAVNGWYSEKFADRTPIGVLKSEGVDNTIDFKGVSEEKQSYPCPFGGDLEAELSDDTCTPSLYRDCYGVLKISGDRTVTITPQSIVDEHADFFRDAATALGAGPMLVRGGTRVMTEDSLKEERFYWKRLSDHYQNPRVACPPGGLYHADYPHPRTAIGLREDGRLMMVTVKGRNPREHVGMNLADLSFLMQRLGACDAMNLDGGGSSIHGIKKASEKMKFASGVGPVCIDFKLSSCVIAEQK